jgi:hypothetical protein
MEATVGILRDLWRTRSLVALFFLVSAAVGLLLLFRPGLPPQSRAYSLGAASAQILVDTPESQMVQVAPKGSETLGARASLLANLMAQGELKAAIARRVGLRPDDLLTAGPGASAPTTGDGATVTPGPDASVLTTGVVTNSAGQALPIVSVAAQAPDAQRAAKLADAAVAGLGAYLDAKAAAQRVAYAHRLRARGLGPAQGHTVSRGPGRMVALIASLFTFAALCGSFLLVSALARAWRLHPAEDDVLDDLLDDPDPAEFGAFDGLGVPEDEDPIEWTDKRAAPAVRAAPAPSERAAAS